MIFSESQGALQLQINKMYEYCHRWELRINGEKSKIVVFKKRNQPVPEQWSYGNPTGTSPTDADAITAATLQTSAVIVYTLYDSRWSKDSCIRTSKSNIVVYNDRFSLVSVNVRVKLQWLQLERSENQQPIPGPRMRL